MFRFHLSLVGLFIIPLSALLLVRHFSSGSDWLFLHELLYSKECTVPCFMGLRPGETSSFDARTLLGEHGWVERVESRLVGGQGGYIYWYWNAETPSWIDTSSKGVIWVAQGKVSQIWVGTTFALGDLMLQFGIPDINIVDENIDYRHGLYQYRGVYGAAGLVAVSWQDCKALDPYRTTIILKFRQVIEEEALKGMEYLDQWKYTFNNCKNRS